MTEEENSTSAAPAADVPYEKYQSLYDKYDVPLDHADFKYLASCTDVKEIEKIVKILRDPREGDFPQLRQCAEERLRELSPRNRLLRKCTPVLTKATVPEDEWKGLLDDLVEWERGVELVDLELGKRASNLPNKVIYPPVRRGDGSASTGSSNQDGTKAKQRISSTDYSSWDKYDAEAEVLKMEVEEEKKREEQARLEKAEAARKAKTCLEEQVLSRARELSVGLSDAEREVYALREKELGNECYKANELESALTHYTLSLGIFPLAVTYNNRAAVYIKMNSYRKALADTNKVLEEEDSNLKALYRRALCKKHTEDIYGALTDTRKVLAMEPSHSAAIQLLEVLEHSASLPKKFKSSGASNEDDELVCVEASRGGAGDGGTLAEPVPSTSKTRQPVQQKKARRLEILELERLEPPADSGPASATAKQTAPVGNGDGGPAAPAAPPPPSPPPDSVRRMVLRELSEEEPERGPIQVALKYREKARRDASPPAARPSPSPPPPTHPPALPFLQAWDLLAKDQAGLQDKAALLRSLQPAALHSAIGSKLDENMLADLVLCLASQFELPGETGLVLDYLTALTRLDRFKIIASFLPTSPKQAALDLLHRLGPAADSTLAKAFR